MPWSCRIWCGVTMGALSLTAQIRAEEGDEAAPIAPPALRFAHTTPECSFSLAEAAPSGEAARRAPLEFAPRSQESPDSAGDRLALTLASWPTFGAYNYVSDVPLKRSQINVYLGTLQRTTNQNHVDTADAEPDPNEKEFDMGTIWRKGSAFGFDYQYVLSHFVSFGAGYEIDFFGEKRIGYADPLGPVLQTFPRISIQSLTGVVRFEAPFGLEEIEYEQTMQYYGLYAYFEARLGLAYWERKKVVTSLPFINPTTGFFDEFVSKKSLKVGPHLTDTLSLGLGWRGDLSGAVGLSLRSFWSPPGKQFKTSHYSLFWVNLGFAF